MALILKPLRFMKRIIFTSLFLFFGLWLGYGQTYTENFDTASNWSGGSMGSYNAKTYELSSPQHNDKFTSDNAVREGTETHSGNYAWRLKKASNVYLRYECEGTVSGFSIYAARWDNSPKPNVTVRYSIDSGQNYTTAFTFTGDDFTGDKVYKQFSHTFSSPITNDIGKKIYIEFVTTAGERMLYDDFSIEFVTASGPEITNITHTPDPVSPSDDVNVSADVTDSDGINSVELHWGTTSGNLSNTISMSNTSGNTYTTVSAIPAQPDGTTVYYEIYAIDNNNDDTTSPEQSYTVMSPNTNTCASELIISEYVEGSSNNKYLEIYNGTGSTINMDNYQIKIYSNGSNNASTTIDLNAQTLDNGDVFVIAHPSADAWNGTPDQTSGNLGYNGDDAIELYNTATGQSVDIIGQIGNDPGSAWGSGNTSTKDHTLRRKPDITSGDTDGSDAFDPATEWDGYPQDNVDDLGQHIMNCGPQLNVSSDTLSGFSYVEGNGPSSSQNFTLSGTSLDGSDVTLTAPTDYEISEDDNTFTTTITLTAYDGSDKTIYVRLKAGLSAGDYNNETISISGGGDSDGEEVILNGTVEAANPEISVEGNGIEIPDGDTTPDTADGTDFGNVEANGGSQTHTFTIKNTGNADLTINSISSSNSEFTLGGTTSGTIAAGGTMDFTVTFTPSSTGTQTATISIDNNDADENPYDFAVQGNGTYSNQSDIVENTGFTYTSNIEYINYQADPITNTSASVGVFKFDIRDGGANGDSDDKGTELTSITFTLTNTSHISFIRSAALFDGNAMKNNTPVIDTNAGTITFSGLSGADFTAPDDGVKSLTLRVSFTTTVTDNEQMQFKITSATASSDGSVFAQSDAGGAQSSISGDRNRIEVVADRIRFTIQPQDGAVNTNLDPFTVSALDANNNKDLDATNSITLTTSGTGMTHNSPYTMSNGDAVISDVQFSTPQTGITITATTSGLAFDNDDTSDPFDILDVPDGSYRTTSDGTWKSTSGGTATWEQFTNGSWQAMTDQPPTDTNNKVYIRHNIELVGTNTASDIVIENGGTINTGNVNQTITNLLVKNGGTYFKNTNGTKVVDNGIIEVEDGGTFKFKHTNGTSLSSNLWNGTEKFHAGSNFILVETDNTSNFMFMESPDDVSSYQGGQFGNLIVDLEDGKLMLLPDNYNDTLTKGDLIFKKLSDDIKFTQTNATCTIGGNLEIESTVNYNITTTTKEKDITLNVNGDFIHNSSEDFRLANSNNGINPNITMNVDGNIVVNGTGALRPDIGSTGTGTNEINLKGDLTVGADAALYSENVHSTINFTGSGDGLTDATTQTVDIATSDDAIENKNLQFNVTDGAYVRLINQNLELGKKSKVTVKAGGVLDFGFNGNTALIVTKSGSQTGTGFDLDAGGYLKITSPDGIWKDSSKGNVQVVASNTTFSPLATFHYIGKEDQVTGDAIGTSSNGRAIIVELENNNLTLTPSVSFGITNATNAHINNGNGGILDIRKGKFVETATEYVTGSTGGLKMEDGTLYKIVKNSADASDYLPRMQGLNNAYELNGGTIELAGDDNQILRGGRDYRNLTFSNADTKTVSSAITSIQGQIYVTDDATLDVEEHTMGGAGTDLVMDNNGIYRTAGTGTKPDAQGNYSLSGNSKIVFTNSSPNDWQTIRLTPSYQNIEITGTNVGNDSQLTGIKFNSGGSFTVKNGAIFKLKNTDGFTGSTSTAISNENNPTIDVEPDATIEYAGDNQTITDFAYPNLNISGTGNKTLGEAVINITNQLNVIASGLYIENDKSISIGGDLTNNGRIIVEHAGSLVQTAHNPSISNGHYILNKTATNLNHYYDYVYWSSPLNSTSFTMENLVSNAAYYKFTPENQNPTLNPDPGWTALDASDTFTPGVGYAISAPSGFTSGNLNVSFSVSNEAFNTGDIIVQVKKNNQGGANLIGNPYPSAIDFDAFANANVNIQGNYGAWTNCAGLDNDGHHQESGYTVYTVGSGATAACSGNGMTTGRYINTGQGFFVEANADGNVTFKNSHRVTGNNNNFIGRETPKDRIWLDLTNQDESVFSQILIGFFPGATDAKDRLYDAHTFGGTGTYWYSLLGEEKFVIQGCSAWDDSERSVPLGFTTNQTGEYVIRINRAEGALENVNIYIHNLQDNTYHLLNDNSFRFHSDAGTFDDLFELVFSPRPLDTDKENLVEYQILTGHDGHFEITAENGIKQITVFDLNGRQLHVYRYQTNPKRVALNLNHLAAGTYLLQIGFENQTTATEKIIR